MNGFYFVTLRVSLERVEKTAQCGLIPDQVVIASILRHRLSSPDKIRKAQQKTTA